MDWRETSVYFFSLQYLQDDEIFDKYSSNSWAFVEANGVYIYVGYRWSYHVALVSRGETENFWSA